MRLVWLLRQSAVKSVHVAKSVAVRGGPSDTVSTHSHGARLGVVLRRRLGRLGQRVQRLRLLA